MATNVTLSQIHDCASPRNPACSVIRIFGELLWPWHHSLSSLDLPPKEPVFTSFICNFKKKICFELVVPLGVTKPIKLVVLFWTWIWAPSLGRESPSFEHSAFIPLPPISGMDLGILIPFPSGLKRPQLEASFQSGSSSSLLCELDPNACADSVLSWTVFVAPPKALAEEGVSFCKWFPTVDGAAGSATG